VPFDGGRDANPLLGATKEPRIHAHDFSSGAGLRGQLVSRLADGLPRQCSQRHRHESSPRLTSCWGAHVQPQLQKKVVPAFRIDGSIVLYRSTGRSLFKAGRSPLRAERWRNLVFGAPLFLRTLLRLVFLCPHRHRGPPIALRESIPPNLRGCRSVPGRGTYITCLDCGQKFAYNHMTRRLVDFWGIHDAKALAAVRRRVDGFFSPFRGLAARVGRLNRRIPMSEFVRSVHGLGILTDGQWAKSRRLIASKWVSRSDLKQSQPRPESN
jgi:hypothetical protein